MSISLNDEALREIHGLAGRYPRKDAALLPVLHVLQRELGWIPPEAEKWTADLLGINPVRIREVVTFYSMYFGTPPGKYVLRVCTNLSCSLRDAGSVLVYLEQKLGIKPGETTPDRKYSLLTVECLGNCDQAPCMMVNADHYGKLSLRDIDEILERLE